MEAEVEKEKVKPKRVRKTPYRKWSDREQQQLANFLRENRPIEKPTAQVYYRRSLAQIESDVEWTLVRCKVKNMRQNFVKAKTWMNSTGAGTMQESETTKDVVARMCPLYSELEDIFGYREFAANASVLDTEDSSTLSCSVTCSGVAIPIPVFDAAEISVEEEGSPLKTPPTTSKADFGTPIWQLLRHLTIDSALKMKSSAVSSSSSSSPVNKNFDKCT